MNWGTNWPKPAGDPRDNLNRDQLLVMWQEAKNKLQSVKDHELELRKYIVKRGFPDATEGTNTQELGNGYELKAKVKYNYKCHSDNNVIEDGLEELAKTGNDGSFVAERLISWTPSFLLTEYRLIVDAAKEGNPIAIERLKIISKFMTITEAAPELEIKEPKRKS